MPMQWVEPELFFEHDGIRVYHAYKEGDWQNRLSYHYTLDPCDEEGGVFDVRTLPGYEEEADHRRLIATAIDSGWLVDFMPGVVREEALSRMRGLVGELAEHARAGRAFPQERLPYLRTVMPVLEMSGDLFDIVRREAQGEDVTRALDWIVSTIRSEIARL